MFDFFQPNAREAVVAGRAILRVQLLVEAAPGDRGQLPPAARSVGPVGDAAKEAEIICPGKIFHAATPFQIRQQDCSFAAKVLE